MSEDTNTSEDVTVEDTPLEKHRDRLEEEADRAVSQFDEGVVDILSWLLDTETRARIYVYLRQHPGSTSEEVAEGTGLYPSTVREALAELAEEGTVSRQKRQHEGAGNNPYEYTAMAPSQLVGDAIGQLQDELNRLITLDPYEGTREGRDEMRDEPVRIQVETAEDEDDA